MVDDGLIYGSWVLIWGGFRWVLGLEFGMGFDLGMDLGMGFPFGFRFLWVLCGFCFDFFVGFVHGGGGSESPQSTFSLPSRISSLKNSQTPTHKPLIAASAFFGSLHLLFANVDKALLEFECSVPAKELHVGAVSYVDVKDDGAKCMTVEGLRSTVVYLQSLTDPWVSIRSVGLKFLGLFMGFSNLGLKFMGLFLGLMFV